MTEDVKKAMAEENAAEEKNAVEELEKEAADTGSNEEATRKKTQKSKSQKSQKKAGEGETAAVNAAQPVCAPKDEMQELIDKAKSKGSISNSEIMVALGDTDYDLDQIDKLYEKFESLGIDITEDFDDDPIDIDEDLEGDI